MKKKTYTAPDAEIEKFYISNIISTSGDLDNGANNEIGDPWNGEDDF